MGDQNSVRQFDVAAAAPVTPAPMLSWADEFDVTDWLPIKDGSVATALISEEWEQAPVGADDVGRWEPYGELVGLRITSADGREELLTSREARALLTSPVISSIEAQCSDEIYRTYFS